MDAGLDAGTRWDRLRAIPGRCRGLLVRHLKQPADEAERFAALLAHVEQLERSQTESQRLLEQLDPGAGGSLAARLDGLNAELAELSHRVAVQQAQLTEAWRRLSSTTTALLDQAGAPAPTSGPGRDTLVSIILPVRDRLWVLRRAVRSVLAQTHQRWELVIVDDQSRLELRAELADLLDDERIVLASGSGAGAAAARNRGLEVCTGDLVTFLDSDNWWYPRRLEAIVGALAPESEWAVDEQVVRTDDGLPTHVRAGHEDVAGLERHNFIDLGMVVVRRRVLDALRGPDGRGPFDVTLARLSDWELVRRLAGRQRPQQIPSIGQVYESAEPDRISMRAPFGPADHAIRARSVGDLASGLRVLCAEWHFPQLSETYIQADIEGLRRLGADVEVWSDEDVAAPYEPGVPWRRGRLEDHIADFQPHVVLTHWLNIGHDLRPITRALGLPHAVRAHGFDYDVQAIKALAADPGVALHLFPHQVGPFAAFPNVSTHLAAFDPGRIRPTADQDRRLVLRLAVGLPTKDLEVFLLTAARCPDHRFVLGLAHGYLVEQQADDMLALARDLGAPVEVLLDVDYAKAAELTMAAGIYLHTHGDSHRLGMPISPIEAMASGSFVLARDLPGSEHLGSGAVRYRGATPEDRADHAAALINDTLTWSDERWAQQRRVALDQAWSHHPADLVVAEMVSVWRNRFAL